MSLFYNIVQRRNPLKKDEPVKYYPVLKSLGKVSEKEVARLIADETTLNPKEAEMTIYQLEKVLKRVLLDGHTVQLGELGTFMLTANSEGADTEKEATADNIKKLSLHFRTSKEMQEALNKATFSPIASLTPKEK